MHVCGSGRDFFLGGGGGIKQPLKKNKTPLNTHSKTSLSIRRRAAGRGGCVWCVRASTAKGKKKKKLCISFHLVKLQLEMIAAKPGMFR